jgi:site-specific DNA-methyltransferase (adenine-specific)
VVIAPQILHCDCLEFLSHTETGIFDLALIDPPYFDYQTHHRKDKESKLSQTLVHQDREDQLKTVQECIRILKNSRSFWFFTNWQEAWWFQERFHTFLHNEVIWDKGNWTAGDLEGSLANKYEVIFLGVKGSGWEYNGGRINDIDGWQIPRVGTNRSHPTEKPVALYKKIIELSTQPGDMIFDPYIGSGASAQAALETGRYFIGCEIDNDYYNIARGRIDECLKS